MSTPSHDLEELQRWMQAVITHPDGVRAGIASAESRSVIDVGEANVTDLVTRSRDCTAAERLEVYGNAYFGRLLECMRDLFPALVFALEEDLFDQFTVGYLQRYPSQSYTLANLADHFVEYLDETSREWFNEEDESAEDKARADWPDFIIDLARLEWTIDLIFDGPGIEKEEVLTAETLQDVSPARWSEARLVPVCCLLLLAFRYPVNDFYTAFRQGDEPALPEPADTFVAITRRDYVVRRIELSQAQYELLSALVEGRSLGEAVAQAAVAIDDVDSLTASLRNWFHIWSAEQLFQRIELPDD